MILSRMEGKVEMKAVIELDVPEWQIGQDVSVYFPDTMLKHGKCKLLKEQAPAKDENSNRRPAYICDPVKNTSCTKEGCMIFHFCRCTTNKEFAKTGENGKPIVAVRSNME